MRSLLRDVPVALVFGGVALLAFPTACGGDEPGGPAGNGNGGASSGGAGKSGSAAGLGAFGGVAGGGGSASAGAAGKSGGSGGPGGVGGNAGSSGGGAAGASGSVDTCMTADDCGVLATKPVKCAEATCEAGKCVFRGKDADADGHRTTTCAPITGGTTIVLGDDCDDADPSVHPGAWDGPADATHATACVDGTDQDCSGVADDGKASDGSTCSCVPGDVRVCDETAAGAPVVFPKLVDGKPTGECKRGSKTCLANGSFGPCTGIVVPAAESCNGKDDDCDGTADEAGATDERYWLWDGDNDLHGAKGYKAILACSAPATPPAECPGCVVTNETWKPNIPLDDCDDKNQSVFPGATEICDGTDNNCDGQVDEGNVAPAVWVLDADGDNHGDAKTPSVKGCVAPGPLYRANLPADDCNDGVAGIHPGAQERCNGVDDDCDGSDDNTLFELGKKCDVNGLAVGACLQAGTWACDVFGTRTCGAENKDIGRTYASIVDGLQPAPAPNGSSDWDCDGETLCRNGSSQLDLLRKYAYGIGCLVSYNEESARCTAAAESHSELECQLRPKLIVCSAPYAGASVAAVNCTLGPDGKHCQLGPGDTPMNSLKKVAPLQCR